nr:MAG TPA: hypothetical protein [Caudoviricetes sp.]
MCPTRIRVLKYEVISKYLCSIVLHYSRFYNCKL